LGAKLVRFPKVDLWHVLMNDGFCTGIVGFNEEIN